MIYVGCDIGMEKKKGGWWDLKKERRKIIGDDKKKKRMKCREMFWEREGKMYLRIRKLCVVIYLRG